MGLKPIEPQPANNLIRSHTNIQDTCRDLDTIKPPPGKSIWREANCTQEAERRRLEEIRDQLNEEMPKKD